jgi:predicted metal-dependent hydrolase
MSESTSATLDWNHGPLAEGLQCYRATEFWKAHEHWEIIWLQLDEPEKSFLRALIQITAAFHHLSRNNRPGAISLLRKALVRLDVCPPNFGGINVARLRDVCRDWLIALAGNEELRNNYPPFVPVD